MHKYINNPCSNYFRYIEWSQSVSNETAASQRRLIAVSLANNKPDQTIGAIRNAVLSQILYPGWTFRVYTKKKTNINTDSTVSDRVLKKLQSLGAEIVFLNSDFTDAVPSPMWTFLVVDSEVDVFIVRDVEQRLGPREVEAVSDWLGVSNPAAVHCMRDGPAHAKHPVTHSLWGGVPHKILKYLNKKMEYTLSAYAANHKQMYSEESLNVFTEGNDSQINAAEVDILITSGFLDDVIYPAVKDDMYCHDSVSCDHWPNSHPFPSVRRKYDYSGRKVDAFDTLVESLVPLPQNISTSDVCRPLVKGMG